MAERPDGYQSHTGHGARIRADVVDVYVFTRVEKNGNDPRERAAAKASTARGYESEAEWPREATKARSHGATKGQDGDVVHFLQALRSGPPLENTWHPVMGHVEAGETSAACAVREMREELGLSPQTTAWRGMWALEQVHPFYIAAIDTVVVSPRFCVEVGPVWTPVLNDEHAEFRWVRETDVDAMFMWPGQKATCREILREVVRDASLSREWLRVKA